MKTIFVILTSATVLMAFDSALVNGQNTISYTGVAKNSKGKAVENGKIALRFTLFDSTAAGKAVYQEVQTTATDATGSYKVVVGEGTAVTGKFSDIKWNVNSKFMKVEMDPKGGDKYTDVEIKEIKNVVPVTTLAVVDTVKTVALVVPPPVMKDTIVKVLVKPVLLPYMTQEEINAVTPIQGMVVFNTTLHKAQIYADINTNQDQINEMYTGTSANSISYSQTFTSLVNGQVQSIEVLVKDHDVNPAPLVLFAMPGYNQNITMGSSASYTWYTVVLSTPQPVTAGKPTTFSFSTFGVASRDFATNSLYKKGEGCCWLGTENDLVFRIHIQPMPGSIGWQNMH
jgi:hypothetical protein